MEQALLLLAVVGGLPGLSTMASLLPDTPNVNAVPAVELAGKKRQLGGSL